MTRALKILYRMTEYKIIYTVLFGMIYSPFCTLFNIDATSQAYYYFHGKCSHDLHSLVPTVQIFMARTYHDTVTESNQLHFFHIPNVRRRLHSNSFCQRTATLCNRLLCECFPKHYSFNFFKSMINHYLFYLSS